MMKKLLILIFITSISVSFSQQSYYNDVDLTLTGQNLKDALATKIIASHLNVLPYTSSQPDTWDALKATDEFVGGPVGDIVLFYGWEDGSDSILDNDFSRDERFQDDASGNLNVWNREHVFPKSLANPILDTNTPGPSTDTHHLRAADKTRNSTRSNRKYGRGTGTSKFSTDTFPGLDGPNTAAWYPGDQWKGDAARMLMYMYIRYGSVCLPTSVGVGSNVFTGDDMIDLFLQWNVEDEVSAIEIARNTYHADISNSAAQGNRNPFIDNPYLATRIWGGNSAQDLWNLYVPTDTQAPTVPANVTLSLVTLSSIDVTWTASTDNVGVTEYDIYVDGVLEAQTASNSITIANLNTNTTYSFTILAKDLINNMSPLSAAVNGTTDGDTQAPTTPSNVLVSNETDSSFKVSWSASTDNNSISGYEVFVDGSLNATTTNLFHIVSGLNTSTTYTVEVLAKDTDNNKSEKSAPLNATTTAGTSNGITELFISEYVEPGSGNEKAIEIVNLTGSTINLADYSIRKFSSTGWEWVDDYPLGNSNIIPGDVFVIVHVGVTKEILLNEADLFGPPNNSSPPYQYGSPMNFNGDDPIGLYKNGVLIDIIGDVNSRTKHIEDVTLRRNSDTSLPNTTYDEQGEWTSFPANTFDGIGSHTSTLNTKSSTVESFKMFPNPTNGNNIYFSVTEDASIHIYNVLGKLIQSSKVTKSKNSINISEFAKGIYLVKINSGKQFITKKLIKN
jgi:endonuclease I/chitodextrinase